MKKSLAAAGLAIAGLSLAPAATASAAEMYMGGLFGVTPQMATITLPDGSKCQTGCQHVTYNNISTTSAYNALAGWILLHGGSGNTIVLYSESAKAGQQFLDNHPNDQNTWVLMGDPADPGNGQTVNPLPPYTNPNPKVTFVTVQGDLVAQPTNPTATDTIHVTGYNNLDETKPISCTPVPNSGALNNLYYPNGVAPTTTVKAASVSRVTVAPTTTSHPIVQLVKKVVAKAEAREATHRATAKANRVARHRK